LTLDFAKLWASHPSNNGDNSPCKKNDGTPAFENQCAIRMGVALVGAGVNPKSINKAKCWFKGHDAHVLRAQELADWLAVNLGAPKKYKKGKGVNLELTVKTDVNGRKGIIFCQNFWGSGNQGDHIDVWDGSMMAHGSTQYFGPADAVWFWEVM
jgi:hypothetical protein